MKNTVDPTHIRIFVSILALCAAGSGYGAAHDENEPLLRREQLIELVQNILVPDASGRIHG